MGRRLRDTANLLNGSTVLGMLVGLFGRGRFRGYSGLVVVDRVRLPKVVTASAMTVGSVVLVPRRSLEEAVARVPELMQHEEEHAWQYAYCFGLPFLPLYGLATAWSLARTGDRARANVFEVQAGLETGGYR
ncbi:MAG: hypothetical protein GX596_03540 [Propionibacterium sp.]|nr:hypothetical protein [Propionibacterium sp.]